MTRAFRAIVSAALTTALMAALHSGTASAQTPEPDPGESEKTAAEQAADDSTGTTTAGSTEGVASDSTGTTPTAAKPVPVKPAKRISKPFEPTEKIDAESVISFPANI
jgi:hypothetical protein